MEVRFLIGLSLALLCLAAAFTLLTSLMLGNTSDSGRGKQLAKIAGLGIAVFLLFTIIGSCVP